MKQVMSMAMIQEETIPTCLHCGDELDEDRDEIGICKSCETPEPESNWSAQYRSDSGGLL